MNAKFNNSGLGNALANVWSAVPQLGPISEKPLRVKPDTLPPEQLKLLICPTTVVRPLVITGFRFFSG